MSTESLIAFILEKIGRDADRDHIEKQLTAVGWSSDEINAAYIEALIRSGVPVPDDKPVSGVKELSSLDYSLKFFSFVLLGTITCFLGYLYFLVIDRFFSDELFVASSYQRQAFLDGIHYSIAALIVAYPLYCFVMRHGLRYVVSGEFHKEPKLIRIFTYFVLFITSITILGDLIYVIFTFLEGELSIRFILKALVVLAIAALVLRFYYLERKAIQYNADVPAKSFWSVGLLMSLLVIVGIVAGFFAAGTPAVARDYTFDLRRSGDLRTLSDCISRYAAITHTLPADIEEVQKWRPANNFICRVTDGDPQSNEPYAYRITRPLRQQDEFWRGEVELCANFAQESKGDDIWDDHKAGKDCDLVEILFRDIKPMVYR